MSVIDNLKEKYTEMKLLETSGQQVLNAAKLSEISNMLTLAGVTPSITGFPTGTVLSSAQTGTGDSTNKWDYGDMGQFGNNIRTKPLLVRIAATGALTPTCTYAIQGSVDDSTYTALQFADSATPTTFGNSTFVLGTASTTVTVVKLVKPGQVFRYLKVVYSLNTNVTNTTDIYELG